LRPWVGAKAALGALAAIPTLVATVFGIANDMHQSGGIIAVKTRD